MDLELSNENKEFLLQLAGYSKHCNCIFQKDDSFPDEIYEEFIKEFNMINNNIYPYVEVFYNKRFHITSFNYLEFFYWNKQKEERYDLNIIFQAMERLARHLNVDYKSPGLLIKTLCSNILTYLEQRLTE